MAQTVSSDSKACSNPSLEFAKSFATSNVGGQAFTSTGLTAEEFQKGVEQVGALAKRLSTDSNIAVLGKVLSRESDPEKHTKAEKEVYETYRQLGLSLKQVGAIALTGHVRSEPEIQNSEPGEGDNRFSKLKFAKHCLPSEQGASDGKQVTVSKDFARALVSFYEMEGPAREGFIEAADMKKALAGLVAHAKILDTPK